jgi:hypothetical protein
MTTKLKPPGTERLRLKCDILRSTSAFKLKLRRYMVVAANAGGAFSPFGDLTTLMAGAYTRSLHSST